MTSRQNRNHRDRADRGIPEATVARLPVYLRALTGLQERGVATVSSEELAAAAGLSSAQAHTYLVSLLRLGLIKRTPGEGHYDAGPLALRLGMSRLTQTPAYRHAIPQV